MVAEMERREKEAQARGRQAAERAAEEERKAAEEKAAREKMEETERLKLEKKEADEKAAAAIAERDATNRRIEMRDALIDQKVQLEKGSIDFVDGKVEAALKANKDLTTALALKAVLEEHPFVVAKPAAPATPTPAAQPPVSTEPPSVGGTPTPTEPAPEGRVDVKSMNSQDFKKHLKEKWNVDTRH